MDLFGAGARPRTREETRVVTGDDAWLAAVLAGDSDVGRVNREAARRMGRPEREVDASWLALAAEGIALRAFGADSRVTTMRVHHRAPIRVGDEVTLVLTPTDVATARIEVRVRGAIAADGTVGVGFEEGAA